MRRVRVMQLVTGLATGEQVGGAELFAIQLARHLDKEQFDPAVIGLWQYASRKEREWISILRSEGIHVEVLTSPVGHLASDLRRAFSGFWSVVSDFRPNIINSHSERTDTFNVLAHIFHPVHPSSMRTMHTDRQWQNRPWAGAVLINLLFPFVFETEFAVSEAVRQVLDNRLLARLKRKKSVLCYNGIDAAMLSREMLSGDHVLLPDGIPEHGPRVGVIGRLTRQKGHGDLIEAIRIVLSTRPVHLLIIGSGPLEQELRQRVSCLGIQEFVHFLGSRDDVLEILPHLALVVSSSLWEGFPTVLLEAMAKGVPVVATDVSGSRELVKTGETGILVPPQNPNRLAEAVLTMINEPTRARLMAENARRLVIRFTIQNAALQYAQAYKRIALAEG